MSENNEYWDEWNTTYRFRNDLDAFMQRQCEAAVSVASELGAGPLRILDIGCGTGWLGNALLRYGSVWGMDLSQRSIEEGQRLYPDLHLLSGSFMQTELAGPFDLIISADSFAHMVDHEACLNRVAELLKPRGTFLLMTQNPRIWSRRSRLRPLPDSVPHARPEEWPSLGQIRLLLSRKFTIEMVSSLDPGGDRGILWWVENRYVRYGMGLVIGRARWRSFLEWAGLGRELVIVAKRA
jgi:SAM-dependent methyltransferase